MIITGITDQCAETMQATLLTLVTAHPGFTVRQLADVMEVEPKYLYRVMPRLVQSGKVRRDGMGYFPGVRQTGVTPEYVEWAKRQGHIARCADGWCAIYADDAEREQLIADGELIRESDGILRVAHPREEDFSIEREDVPEDVVREVVEFVVDTAPRGTTIEAIRERAVDTFYVSGAAITDAMVQGAMARASH